MTRRTFIAAALALAALVSSPAHASPSASGTLQGVVTGEHHGLALHRVSVTLRNESRTFMQVRATDRDGAFRFEDVPPGLYSIEAEQLGYDDALRSPILVLPGRELTEQVILAPALPLKSTDNAQRS